MTVRDEVTPKRARPRISLTDQDLDQASRWFVVPDYRPDATPATSATVVNRAGELVATFESLEDAERAVEAVNGRT